VAYALLVERLTAHFLVDLHMAKLAVAYGAKGVEMPDLTADIAALDAALEAEPQLLDPGQLALRKALGVGRAG
jgi:hypothetical protein